MQIPFGGRGRGRSMRRRMMRNVAQPMPYQGIKGLGGRGLAGRYGQLGNMGMVQPMQPQQMQRPQLFQGFNPLGPRPPGPAQMGYAAPRPMGLQQAMIAPQRITDAATDTTTTATSAAVNHARDGISAYGVASKDTKREGAATSESGDRTVSTLTGGTKVTANI